MENKAEKREAEKRELGSNIAKFLYHVISEFDGHGHFKVLPKTFAQRVKFDLTSQMVWK